MTKMLWPDIGCLLFVVSSAMSSGCSDATDGSKCEPNTKCGEAPGDASTDVDQSADVRGGDGPVPPAPQASISVHIQEYDSTDPTHGMDRCPPGRHWVNVPYQRDRAPSTQTQQTTDSYSSAKAVNNQDGNSVACMVRANGSRFNVSGDATGYASTTVDQRKPSVVHIRIPSIGVGETSAMGTLTLQDDASLQPYTSAQCTFSVQGGSLGVAPSLIWGSVRCEGLSDPSTPGSACQMDTGFFIFENCSQ